MKGIANKKDMKRRKRTTIMDFLIVESSETGNISRVEIFVLILDSTRGNRLGQMGLIFLITGFEVADGNAVTMLPDISLTEIRSETVGIETSIRVLL